MVAPYQWIVKVAEPVASKPQGFDSQNTFINVVLCISGDRPSAWTTDELLQLLDRLQHIEQSISTMPHRNPDGSYRDREIDIDIVAVDDIVLNHPRLTLPHAKVAERAFVLAPLSTLDPDWEHPLLHKTAAELLAALPR